MKSRGKKIEQKVRDKLTKEFGIPLSERELVMGRRSTGDPIPHKFDLVSDDKKLVGEVKSYKFSNKTTGKAGYTSTRKARLLEACFYLGKVKAKTKLLVLTNKKLYKEFSKDMDGLLSSKIEIKYLSVK